MAKKNYLDYSGLQKFLNKIKDFISDKVSTITPSSIGASATGHKHSASDITSGSISVSRGGTGKSTLTTNNFLVGNGTGAMQEKTPSQVLDLIGASSVSKIISVTLTKSGWSDNSQRIYNTSIEPNGYIFIIFADSDSETSYYSAGVKAQEVTTSNYITFVCNSIPDEDLKANILILEAN